MLIQNILCSHQSCRTSDVNKNEVYEDNVIYLMFLGFLRCLYAQIYQNGLHIAYVHFDSENTLSKRLLVMVSIYFWLLICYRGWFGNGLILGGGDQPDWTGTAWAYWWTGHHQ